MVPDFCPPHIVPCERLSLSDLPLLRCVQQLKDNGFCVDELFQQCLFEEDEKEMVLSAIRTIQPSYQLPPPPKPQICQSSLLRDFYSKVSDGAQGCPCGREVLELDRGCSQVSSGPAQGCDRGRKYQPDLCSAVHANHKTNSLTTSLSEELRSQGLAGAWG